MNYKLLIITAAIGLANLACPAALQQTDSNKKVKTEQALLRQGYEGQAAAQPAFAGYEAQAPALPSEMPDRQAKSEKEEKSNLALAQQGALAQRAAIQKLLPRKSLVTTFEADPFFPINFPKELQKLIKEYLIHPLHYVPAVYRYLNIPGTKHLPLIPGTPYPKLGRITLIQQDGTIFLFSPGKELKILKNNRFASTTTTITAFWENLSDHTVLYSDPYAKRINPELQKKLQQIPWLQLDPQENYPIQARKNFYCRKRS